MRIAYWNECDNPTVKEVTSVVWCVEARTLSVRLLNEEDALLFSNVPADFGPVIVAKMLKDGYYNFMTEEYSQTPTVHKEKSE